MSLFHHCTHYFYRDQLPCQITVGSGQESSDGHGLAWPESWGFGLAQGGFGFPDHQARPQLTASAWQGLALAQAVAFQEHH